MTNQMYPGYFRSTTIIRNKIERLNQIETLNMKAHHDVRKVQKSLDNYVSKYWNQYPEFQRNIQWTIDSLRKEVTRIVNLPEQH